ncbi:MAG: LamG domain-containing protein, partial [Verrucomicrobiota bacterium]
SAVTNGTGCGGPMMVTRTWEATDNYPLTSRCVRTFMALDEDPPLNSCEAQSLTNPGFEFGDFTAWTLVGAGDSNPRVSLLEPAGGFFHAILEPYTFSGSIYSLIDTHFDEHNGFYNNEPDLERPGAAPGTATSVKFDGVDQRTFTDISNKPRLEALVDTTSPLSFAIWIRPRIVSGTQRIYHVGGDSCRMLYLSDNRLIWRTANYENSIFNVNMQTGVWTHVALTVDNDNNTVLYRNGALFQARSHVDNPGFTNCPDDTIQFFRGRLDDFQLYDIVLNAGNINDIYTNPGVPAPNINPANLVTHYPLDDPNLLDIGPQTVFYQDLDALPGESWGAGISMQNSSLNPLRNNAAAFVSLQFLDASSNVLTSIDSDQLTRTTTPGVYALYSASGIAPAMTAKARIRVTTVNDGSGEIFYDRAYLTPLELLADAGTCQATVIDYSARLTVLSNNCGNVTITQSPPAGTMLFPGIYEITLTATDECGLSSTCTVDITVVTD